MRIRTKTDALGALVIGGMEVILFRNDTTGPLTFNFSTNGENASIVDEGNLIITIKAGGDATLTLVEGGSYTLQAGAQLILKKPGLLANPAFTPIIDQDWNDPVFMKQIVITANMAINRDATYWRDATLLASLGITSVAGIAAAATVNLSEESIQQISDETQVGHWNFVG